MVHCYIIIILNYYSRFCYINFIVFYTLLGIILPRIVIMYDIICQWSKKLRKRMEELPPELQITETTQLDVSIPGWYINGHGEVYMLNTLVAYFGL